jgi:hypothetical protein
VPEQVSVAADRTALLDRYVTELILLAKAQRPEAVVEVPFTRYEDEDAHLVAFLPEKVRARRRWIDLERP